MARSRSDTAYVVWGNIIWGAGVDEVPVAVSAEGL